MRRSVFLSCAAALLSIIGPAANAAAAARTGRAPTAKVRDWSAVVSQTPAGGFVMGNPNAKIKLVEYGSMTCPHCARFDASGVPNLIDKYVKTGEVSWEFRNYVRDALDLTAALIARCNGARSFFPVMRTFFEEQPNWETRVENLPQDREKAVNDLPPKQKFAALANLAGLSQLAAARGLPAARSKQCLSNDGSINQLVKMTGNATTEFPDFKGTPTFVINGAMVDLGPVTEAQVWPALESKIRAALGGRR
ncbi:MAG TPA: thioredoxin domain-containing protein [Sphingomicrobium sp.]|nr:thioredoxin domain-containing protein [Sphingomicrobium sp.]